MGNLMARKPPHPSPDPRLQLDALGTPSIGSPYTQGAHGEGGLHDDWLPAPWDPGQLFPRGRGQPSADPG